MVKPLIKPQKQNNMKQTFFLLIACVVLLSAKAQTVSFSQTASNSGGAITNTSVDTMTRTLSKSYSLVSIQPVVTKATGTMAGWAVLDYSLDGTTWYVGTDSLSLTNVTTQTIVWNKQTSARYFRVRVGGATTVTGTATAKVSVTQ